MNTTLKEDNTDLKKHFINQGLIEIGTNFWARHNHTDIVEHYSDRISVTLESHGDIQYYEYDTVPQLGPEDYKEDQDYPDCIE